MRESATIVSFGLLLVAGLGGCQPQGSQPLSHTVATQAAAGTTTVAVTAVEPWADVEDELAPAFKLADGDAALNRVLPTTEVIQQKVLDHLGFGLSVGLPTESFSQVEKVTQASGQAAPARSEETTRTTQSGTATPQPVDPGSRTAAALALADLPTSGPTLDPFLQYQTALALFQEVKELNRYIRAAAMRYCFEPYLLRMQVGVTPYGRRQPYDVYTRVSFFPGELDALTLGQQAADTISDAAPKPLSARSFAQGRLADGGQDPCDAFARSNPRIVPLLVTDNLELTRQQRTQDAVRQLKLALTAAYQGVAADATLQRLAEALEAVGGNSLNSLTSVTRLTDNTVQARLGAANDPSIDSKYGRSMVPRNYNISLLLLVPKAVARQSLPRVLLGRVLN
jgi:hypothetical protein